VFRFRFTRFDIFNMADDESRLAVAIKSKFPGLSSKDIRDIIKGIKKDNNGTLKGMKKSAIMGLVKKNIHEQNRLREIKIKEERQESNETCPICF
jgi:hypothetical protein